MNRKTGIILGLLAVLVTTGVKAQLEEIVVTATKRGEQALQSIPASIFALDQNLLEKMGVVNFADFAANVAGLDLVDSGPGDKKYIIRGINGEGEAQVAVYYDNMPVTGIGGSATDYGGTQTDFDMYDIERVEVLRGPQGTLYGANSMSGAVRIIANKPDLEGFDSSIEVDGSATKGGSPSYSLKGMLNFPLGEKVAFRGVAYYKDFGGFIDAVDIPNDYQKLDFFGPGRHAPLADDDTWEGEDINESETKGVRLGLQAQFSENTSLLAQLYYEKMETGFKPHMRADDSRNVITNIAFGGAGDLNNVVYARNHFDDEVTMGNLTFEHDFGATALTFSASTFDREVFSEGDTSVSFKNLIPAPVVPFSGFLTAPQDAKMDSFELRLNTQLDGPVNALVGAFYQDREINFENWLYLLNGPNDPDTSTQRFNRITMDNTSTKALFGEITWQPNEKWTLLGGLRYFETERDVWSQLKIGFFGFPGNPAPPEIYDTDEDDTIFKLSLSYNFNDDVLGYAEISEGFRAGGTNSAQVAGVPGVYGPDKTTNYELGIKSTLADNTMVLNASVYRIEWSDQQLTQCFGFDGQPDPSCPFSAIINVEGDVSEAQGFEVDFAWYPADNWTITSAISLNDTGLINTLDPAGFGNTAVEGTSMIGARKFTFAAAAQYNFPVSDMWDGWARADFQHLDGIEYIRWDDQNIPTEDYQNLNLRVGMDSEKYSAMLYVINATDERAQLNLENSFGFAGRVTTNLPRTIGLRLSWNY